MNLSKNVKVVLAKAGQSAGTSAINTDEIDMQDWDGVVFVGSIATANAGNYAKAQQDTVTGMGSAADLEGTKVTPGDSGDSFLIDLYKPRERFVRAVITRGASTATGDVYAILYKGRKAPVTHGSTIDSEVHVSPAEGTA